LSEAWKEYGLRVISGEARGAGAAVLRAGLSVVSPVYAGVMRLRNAKYDKGVGVRRLARPVVSVGNLTTGGTGKTPVVRWLCEALRGAGERPAVLMRGYLAAAGEKGDEERLLDGLLNRDGAQPVVVHAGPDRVAGGEAVLGREPGVSVFVLDDGFQHRRLGRDFDLVLIDASQPYWFGRVIPRGLLREPLAGLGRADAVLITRADQGDAEAIEKRVRALNGRATVYRSTHAHVGFRAADGTLHAVEALAGRRYYAFAGIGNPRGFGEQLRRAGAVEVGSRWFGDHWAYGRADVEQVLTDARKAGAEVVVTTEKDWVKVAPLLAAGDGPAVWRAELAIRFEGEDEGRLLAQVRGAIEKARRR
jgi:tetraacyldisaccharide 4'-kinase